MTPVDPTLGRIPRVLVPIQVDAMVLRSEVGGFADCRMRTPDPTGPQLQQLMPEPFTDLPGTRPPGVYLHWALPDALAHERPVGDGTVTAMPAMPDRWVVTRFSLGATPEHRRTTSWVIEASGDPPVLTPLSSWTESGNLPTPGQEPTVLGHGDLGWSAYYENVINRLGFFDPLEDATTGPLAYLVCGWYADTRLDPLANPSIGSLSDFHARLADLGWSLPPGEIEVDALADAAPSGPTPPVPAATAEEPVDAAFGEVQPPLITDGSWWPTGLLCHGSVVGLGWPDAGFPYAEDGLLGSAAGGPPAPDQTRVAFGTTPTDALGALMVGFLAAAEGVPAEDVLSEDRMLEAFQCGLLAEIDHPDGRIRLDAGLHANGFHSTPGGQRTQQVPAPQPPADPIPLAGTEQPNGTSDSTRVVAQSTGGSLAADLNSVESGGLEDLLATAGTGTQAPPAPDAVQRSLPRWFSSREPSIVVQGIKRSLKHGGDGRFTQDGTLACRLSGFVVDALTAAVGVAGERAAYSADDLLETAFDPHGAPFEVVDLVHETVLLDPGSARAAALHVAPTPAEEVVLAFMVEQTVWWALRDPLIDPTGLLAHCGLAGTLPSPLAVTPPALAWAPRHLDWSVEVFPTPGGATGWSLGEIDLTPDNPAAPTALPGTGRSVTGRALLTGGVAAAAAAAGRQAIDIGVLAGTAGVAPGDSNVFVPASNTGILPRLAGPASTPPDSPTLPDAGTQTIANTLVAALRDMDVLSGSLQGLHAVLRDEPTGQLVGTTDPTAPEPNPDATGVIAGLYRPVRMRLVDCFGQVVDLLDSGPDRPADPTMAHKARTVTIPGRPDVIATPPRFTSPARLMLRFIDADPTAPPKALEDSSEEERPVCGYVLPDHLDGTLEFFDTSGAAVGSVEPSPDGDGRAVWTSAPGTPSVLGRPPSQLLTDPHLGALADTLVTWGVTDATRRGEGALAAILRMVDSTLWSVDPFAHAGDEHLSLLTGHPVVVARAAVRLDLDDPLHPRDSLTTPVTVRLGALSVWEDGLLGFIIDGEPDIIHASGAAALELAREVGPGRGYLGPIGGVQAFHHTFADDLAQEGTPRSPITHPYVSPDPFIQVWPGHPVGLTLLLVPQAVVHATTGILPRKELGVRRQWIADALNNIAPSFRFGPVLVDPKTIRMPVAAELAGSWSWNHRRAVTDWIDEPVTNATGDAMINGARAVAEEGWLTMHPRPQAPS